MSKATKLAIRMARQGCANRPFYHIQVMSLRAGQHDPPIEQLGVYDPMPNENHERVVSFNFDRIKYWLAQDVQVSKPVAELMGTAMYYFFFCCLGMSCIRIF